MKRLTVIILLFCAVGSAHAQMSAGQVDIFMGVDFNYRDIFHNGRVYDVLLNLTPGVKWNLGRRWEMAAQALVPVINQYGDQYKNVRLNMAVLAKQMPVGSRLRLKLSGGLYTWNRYGLDVKGMLIANSWLAFDGEIGLTGMCSMSSGWHASEMKRITFLLGPNFWINRYTTQIWARAGRFTYGDYGVIAEAFRHFKHVSVGIYGSYSNESKENAGFKVVVMLPPYKRTRRRVNFRPASNFRLTYRMEADYYTNREYFTDPEQNERSGWFDRDMLPWGPDTTAPDYIYKEKKPKEAEIQKGGAE